MPASIPTRPTTGATIATTWGQDVHDRTYTPQGVQVNGAVAVGVVATDVKLPIDSLAFGNPAYMDAANDQIVIPPQGSGLYAVFAMVAVTNTASWVRTRIFRNGAAQAAGDTTRGIGAAQAWASIMWYVGLADGDTIDFRSTADAADAADVQLFRAGVLRVGNAIASTGP